MVKFGNKNFSYDATHLDATGKLLRTVKLSLTHFVGLLPPE